MKVTCIILLMVVNSVTASKPNILVLMIDDLGYGDLGCYGNKTLPTPNIDRLASQGVRFTQALAGGATCTPSRAAFLTSRYPIRSGLAAMPGGREVILFTAQSAGLPNTELTLSKVLVRHGYSTSYIGKWHLGVSCRTYGDNCHSPNAHGFQYWYGMPMTNLKDFGDDGVSVTSSYMPRLFPTLYAVLSASCLAVLVFRPRSLLLCSLAFLVALCVTLALLFISNLKIINSQLMLNGEVVEQPIRLVGLTQRFVAETKQQMKAAQLQNMPFFIYHAFSKVHTHLATVAAFSGRSQHGLYGDSVLELDWAVGELMAELDRLRIADHTLVYLTSDNGAHLEETGARGDPQGGSNAPLRGGKLQGGMEGGIRVPTLLRYPPLTGRGGATVDAPVSLMDLFPTVLSAAGVDSKVLGGRDLDGRDLTPLLTGQTTASPHQFLFHYCGSEIHAMRWMENEATTWKVHFFWPRWLPGQERCEFACLCDQADRLVRPVVYNIQADISEQRPLSTSDPRYSAVVARCRQAAAEHSAGVTQVPAQLSWTRMMWRPGLQPCCTLPYCTCHDPKYPGPF